MQVISLEKKANFSSDLASWISRRLWKRKLLTLCLAITIIFASTLVNRVLVQALSKAWVQTDWSGGADTNATANSTNLTDWTQYYSGTNTDHATGGEIKLQRVLSTPAP